jgi:sulfonate transport system substrate-binding protein
VIRLVVRLAVALFTAACVFSASGAEALKEIRIGYQKAGIFPAVKQRRTLEEAFKPLGIEVKWVEFAFGPPLLEALNTGNVDFGYTGNTPPIFAQAASANLLYVAVLPTVGSNEAVVVPANSPIRTLADLKGKRIGFGKGSSAHDTTIAALEKAGLSYADVTPVYLGPADAMAAFARGSLDAWTIWDPYLALAERTQGARVVAFSKDVHNPDSFFLANRAFTAAHADTVARLNAVFAKEADWADGHRAEVAERLHEATGVELLSVKRAVDRTIFKVIPLSAEIVAEQQAVADRFYKLGLIPKPIVVQDIVWTWKAGS